MALLAPLGHGDVVSTWVVARWLGAVAVALAVGVVVGHEGLRSSGRGKLAVLWLLLLATSPSVVDSLTW
jgi:hypothetical protein